MRFIIYNKDGSKEVYDTKNNEESEADVDAAWDEVYSLYDDAEYIEEL